MKNAKFPRNAPRNFVASGPLGKRELINLVPQKGFRSNPFWCFDGHRCSGIVAVLPLKLLGAEEFCVKILRPGPNVGSLQHVGSADLRNNCPSTYRHNKASVESLCGGIGAIGPVLLVQQVKCKISTKNIGSNNISWTLKELNLYFVVDESSIYLLNQEL